ncbi:hypothetical protein [Streptomyces roseicoloratus]|uniref:hypothetical protein n=1 Tax=Streptomyces roseicoloratus TaxID=2508722 RepID=UPI001009B9B6|nr:hypothetical protein [Streptomyces roseicoloratus]
MAVLTWVLLAAAVAAVAACLAYQRRRRDPGPWLALVLSLGGLLPLPVLLAYDASAAAWGVWGAIVIAAALVWAAADTLRDTAAARGRRSRGRP